MFLVSYLNVLVTSQILCTSSNKEVLDGNEEKDQFLESDQLRTQD